MAAPVAATATPPTSAFSVESTYGATSHTPIRWGFLGTGKIAEDFANALQPCKDIVLQAIGSRSIESANTFADLFSIPNRHASYAELVGDSTVDVIYISTPDAVHAEHAKLALEAGKHVLLEKPATQAAAEFEEIATLARKKGVFVMEAMWTRFVPAVVQLLDLIRSGTIGRVSMVHSDFGCPFPIPSGALNALGVYDLALAQMVYDTHPSDSSAAATVTATPVQPSKIFATGSLRADGRTDDQVGCLMQYGPTQLASFTASLLIDSHKEALIVGEKGRIRMTRPLWHSTNRVVVELNGQQAQEISFEGLEAVKFVRSFNLLNSERLIYEALEVNRCVREKRVESPAWTHAQTTHVMRLMEEIRRQIR